jgi:hypothetical protein
MRAVLLLLIVTLSLFGLCPTFGADATETQGKARGGSALSAEFSGFRIQRGSARTDWFATVKNTSGVNMPRNRFEVRATQTSEVGQVSSAGSAFTLTQDLGAGRTVNLQRQFSPARDISRVTLEIVDLRSAKTIGSTTFPATTAQSGPGRSPQLRRVPGQGIVKPGEVDLNRYLLALTLHEKPNREIGVLVKNIGSGPVDLSQFAVSITGHQLARPDQTQSIALSGELKPGDSAGGTTLFTYSYCASFTHYSALASGMGKQFETRFDVVPANLRIDVVSLVPRIPGGGIDEDSTLDIKFQVTNDSGRSIERCYLEGVFTMEIGRKYKFYRINMPVGGIQPGTNPRVVTLNLGATNFDPIRYHSSTELWDMKPTRVGVQVRLRDDAACGLAVYHGNISGFGMRLDD